MSRFHRTMTRPFFTKERISHFEVFDRHSEDALEKARVRLSQGYAVDFQDLVSRFTLDSATEFLFGNDVKSLSSGLPYPPPSPSYPPLPKPSSDKHPSTRFVDAFLAGQTLSASRSPYGPSWALLEFWKNRVLPHRAVIDEFVEPILKVAIEKSRIIKESNTTEKGAHELHVTLLDHLVSQTEAGESTGRGPRYCTVNSLSAKGLALIVLGQTASALTFAMYMLTEHPGIAIRLRAEILQAVGMGSPTYDQIKEMKFLRAFINGQDNFTLACYVALTSPAETLRLHPPVPFDSRTSITATTLPNRPTASNPEARPFYVPARTNYGVYVMHRRKDLWGPDALQFDPDRFLDERLHKYLTPNPFIFLPFNAGPRICLGQQFAYHEISFFLIRLLQRFARFRLAQPTEGDGVHAWVHLTMYVKGGLWVWMEPASLDGDVDPPSVTIQ
ncbi:hypothetical protein DXG01_012611 [Tephrocybe rancida]|nr:hypothetical protein DXG01_012611 [Tephrocybe rancida]